MTSAMTQGRTTFTLRLNVSERVAEAVENWIVCNIGSVAQGIEGTQHMERSANKRKGCMNILTKSKMLDRKLASGHRFEKDACPMWRAERRVWAGSKQWQVGQGVQECRPRPWEDEKFRLTRERQWHITELFL